MICRVTEGKHQRCGWEIVSLPHFIPFNRNKSIKFTCIRAEIEKNTRLLQKRLLKKIQLSKIFLIFVPSYQVPLCVTVR